MDQYIGEIRMFGGNFAPRDWTFCEGQILSVSSNAQLFSVLGTIYGGDGSSDFGLPDMRARLPMHYGQGVGLTDRLLGAKFGQHEVTLTIDQMPAHSHNVRASNDPPDRESPSSALTANVEPVHDFYRGQEPPYRSFSSEAISEEGGALPHSNMVPSLAVHFIMALQGVYPPQS